MNIVEITYSNERNDFKALYQCSQCGHQFEAWGYSDHNFYNNVMPNAICPKCGKNSKGETEEQLKERTGYITRIQEVEDGRN